MESMNSLQVAASPAPIPAGTPAAPGGLTVKPGDSKVELEWNAVPGAHSYTVKRAVSYAGPYTVMECRLDRNGRCR